MKFWTGLILFMSMASLPVGAGIVTLTPFYKKLASMFQESCHQSSEGLEKFGDELAECYERKAIPKPGELRLTGVPLGVEDDVPDQALYASSYRDDHSYPGRGRLNAVKAGGYHGAWCAAINNDFQFFQVDIGFVGTVTAVLLQGDHAELNWVQSFTLEISLDGFHWGCVFGSDGRVKVFEGNEDSDTVKINIMHPYIITRYIRIKPKSWTGQICLRTEIFVKEKKPREDDQSEYLEDVEAEVLEVNPKKETSWIIKNDPGQVDTGVVPELYVERQNIPDQSISFQHLKVRPELYEVLPAGVDGKPLSPNIKLNPFYVTGGGTVVDRKIPPGQRSSWVTRGQTRSKNLVYTITQGGVGGKPLSPNIKSDPFYIAGGGPVVDRTIAPGPYAVPLEVGVDYLPSPYLYQFDWCPRKYETNMYMEVAFPYPVSIVKFSTSALDDSPSYVSAYTVKYLYPQFHEWLELHGKDRETTRIEGNTDNKGQRDHIYKPAIFTNRFRMYILDYEKQPCMSVQLYMYSEPRGLPQIVTGPVYQGGLVWWAWEEAKAEVGYTQEAYFENELTLKSFGFDDGSVIQEYELQYLNSNDQWVYIYGEESTVLSNGEGVDVDGIVAKGIRIKIISLPEWEVRLYAAIKLEVYTDTDNEIKIMDIVELSGHYIYDKWQDLDPVADSSFIFYFHGESHVTRIETRGIDGSWVSSYHLECRTHFSKSGPEYILNGNTNDADIVEHVFTEPLKCKYVLITPTDMTGGIGMEIYLYTDRNMIGTTTKISVPGSIEGHGYVKWDLVTDIDEPGNPYVEFNSPHNHRITLVSIEIKALEDSSVENFQMQKSTDGKEFEPILGLSGENIVVTLGETKFDRKYDVQGLRIFPVPPSENYNGHLGFEATFYFKSEKKVEIQPEFHTGRGSDVGTGVISGSYESSHEDAGSHFVFLTFGGKASVKGISLKYSGSKKATVNIGYKEIAKEASTPAEYKYFYEDPKEISADNRDISIDLKYSTKEMEIIVSTSGESYGEGDNAEAVEFEYEIKFTGNIGTVTGRKEFKPKADETEES